MQTRAVLGLVSRSASLAFLGAAAIVGLAYGNAPCAALLVDSQPIALADPRFSLPPAEALRRILTQDYWAASFMASGQYRPLTTLTYWLQHLALGSPPPAWSFIVVNLLLHLANAMLVGLVLGRVLPRPAAWTTALVFAVHPLTVEAVTNVVGRADLLATVAVFGILAIDGSPRACGAGRRNAACIALFGIGVFSKENAVVALALVPLARACVAARAGSAMIPHLRASWPLTTAGLALTAAFLAARDAALPEGAVRDIPFVLNPTAHLDAVERILTASSVLWFGLGLLVWPARLSWDYSYAVFQPVPFPPNSWEAAWAVLGTLALVVAVLGAVLAFRRYPTPSSLALAWFCSVAPTSNVFLAIGTIFGERLLYCTLPWSLGLMAWGAWSLLRRTAPAGRVRTTTLVALAGVVLVAGCFALRTHLRNRDWQSSHALFAESTRTRPESQRVHQAYASVLLAEGKSRGDPAILAEAMESIRRAAAIDATLPERHRLPDVALIEVDIRLALADLAEKQDTAAARDHLQEALRILESMAERERRRLAESPVPAGLLPAGNFGLSQKLGTVLRRLGRAAEALPWIERTVAWRPVQPEPFAELAETALAAGDADLALLAAFQLIITAPSHPSGIPLARRALLALGTTEEVVGGTPGNAAFAGGHPVVRKYLDRACAGLYRLYLPHGDAYFIEEFRRRAIEDYGCPAELFVPRADPKQRTESGRRCSSEMERTARFHNTRLRDCTPASTRVQMRAIPIQQRAPPARRPSEVLESIDVLGRGRPG